MSQKTRLFNQHQHQPQPRSEQKPAATASKASSLCQLGVLLCSSCVFVIPQTVLADSYRTSPTDWYLGLNVGESRLSLDTATLAQDMSAQGLPFRSVSRNTNDTGFKLYAGMPINGNLAVEGGYFRLGEVDFSAVTGAAGGSTYPLSGHFRDQGANLDLVARMFVTDALSVIGRVGLTYNDTDARLNYQRPINLDQYDRSKHYLKHKFGVGAEYQLAPAWSMRLELERYRQDDLWGDQGDMKLLSLGLVYRYAEANYAAPTAAPTTAPMHGMPPKHRAAMASEHKMMSKEPVDNDAPIRIELEDIHFQFAQSTLTEQAKIILKNHVETLKTQPQSKVVIAGYTSASGSESFNQSLSEQRAQSVKRFLVEEGGVMGSRLTTIGYGESSPAEVESSPKDLRSKAAKANMRVLFQVSFN